MRIINRIAARLLDKLIELVPERTLYGQKVEDAPPIWRYTIEDYATGSPYLTRVLFPRVPVLGFRPMLHKFHRPDGDRALHNHPWKWSVSFILAGEYIEERLLPDESQLYGCAATESRLVRWFNVLTDHDFHRILELRGSVYTLFVTGPRTQDWGFLPEDAASTEDVVHWRTYIDARRAELEVDQATGEALDKIGKVHNVERWPARRRHGDLYAAVERESDTDYRERIRAVISGLLA